ncbi:LysR family transcriptional regulator [Starkeya sp. ORNL1]|uniref:LysR substrate-binding domain-containing protein n=1 Tax=Starkeya sp. ORNL1 TaxID=2709380 RepID=UPI001462B8E6|nr:LysR substrate-binding domain-containing protein [Starkeya sp. ORNL1]QJP13065.1 LysR family transcriptional regulator [Starkeya sp. ORNL1]
MRLEQLKFLCAIVDNGFSITRAAEALHISQPGISKQINSLELELGAELLVRVGGRIVGLTGAGHTTLAVARRVLLEINDLVHSDQSLKDQTSGRLTIATTHTHARYALLPIIKDFRQAYPLVHLHLLQANPAQVIGAIASGTADVGITSAEGELEGELRIFRGRDLARSVIAPIGHPVFRETPLTLKRLSSHPLLTLDASFPGGHAVHVAFERAGIEPNIAMTAIDADVIKAYVRVGLGIAVLPTITFERTVDPALDAIDATHLFGSAPVVILTRPETRLSGYMADFINRVAPGQLANG